MSAAPDLLSQAEDHARQLEALANRLACEAHPGHMDFISKADAAVWLRTLVAEQRSAIAKARGES